MKRTLQFFIVLITMFALQSFAPATSRGGTTVYICVTGKVYHATKDCRGLKNATHEIKAVSLAEAKKTRRACKICYN